MPITLLTKLDAECNKQASFIVDIARRL